MEIKINFRNFIFAFTIAFNSIYMIFSFFGGAWVNKLVVAYEILVFFYLITHLRWKHFDVWAIVILAGYAIYISLECSFSDILSLDFYSYALLLLIFMMILNNNVMATFISYFLENKKIFDISTLVFFGCIIISILMGTGLRTGWGTTVPILYGPYSLPHILAYQLIAVYCGAAIFYKKTRDKIYFVLKMLCIVLTLWTAARSGVLGMAFIVIADYFSIRRVSMKAVALIAVGLLVAYLLMFTDILINNPLIQKTLNAIDNGSITNGREDYVNIAMSFYWSSTNTIEKLFGSGITGVRQAIKAAIGGSGIHAHNDYVNIWVGYGFFGLVLFVVAQIKQVMYCEKFGYKLLWLAVIFILSYYNGLAMYVAFTPQLLVVAVYFMVIDCASCDISEGLSE